VYNETKVMEINTPLGGIYCLRNRAPDNPRAAVAKREEKCSLKMLDPVEAKWFGRYRFGRPGRMSRRTGPFCRNLASASLAVSTAITFAFLA